MRAAPWLPFITALLATAGVLSYLVQLFGPRPGAACFGRNCPPELLARQARMAAVQSILGLISLPAVIFEIGWLGTERIWFLRIFRGKNLSRAEGWSFTWKLFGRYFRLGFLFLLIYGPFSILAFARTLQSLENPQRVSQSTNMSGLGGLVVVASLATVLLDFALTFVTPALAYTTAKVTEAIRIGLRMISSAWPNSALYVLVPPLAILVVFRLAPASVVGPALKLVFVPAATLFNLWFKGATASFYLRHHPEVGEDGAVFMNPPQQSDGYDWSRVR